MFKKLKTFHPVTLRGAVLLGLLTQLAILAALSFPPTVRADFTDVLKSQEGSIRGRDLKVATLLQAIGHQAGINFYVDDRINETINLTVDNLTLYDIFQIIMEAKKLHYTEKNSIVYIEREKDFQAGNKKLLSKRICTRFGNVALHLDKLRPLLSPEGSVTETNWGNCLIVRDQSGRISRIEEILAELDQPIPQVHIEARIVTISQEAKHQLGIKWGYDNLSTRRPIKATGDLSVNTASNLAVGFIRNNMNLSVDLQAMQQDDKLRILSSPQILVLNNQEAEIKQGKEVPYVTESGGTINTSFREANLSLKVTPKVMQDNYIVLNVVVTNDSVDNSSISGGEPLINTQSITTSLFLEDEVTVVIGGILLESSDSSRGRIPGFADLPLIGGLFRNSNEARDRSELLVFITPRIVQMSQGAEGAAGAALPEEVAAPGPGSAKTAAEVSTPSEPNTSPRTKKTPPPSPVNLEPAD